MFHIWISVYGRIAGNFSCLFWAHKGETNTVYVRCRGRMFPIIIYAWIPSHWSLQRHSGDWEQKRAWLKRNLLKGQAWTINIFKNWKGKTLRLPRFRYWKSSQLAYRFHLSNSFRVFRHLTDWQDVLASVWAYSVIRYNALESTIPWRRPLGMPWPSIGQNFAFWYSN